MLQIDYPFFKERFHNREPVGLELRHLVPREFTDLALGFVTVFLSKPIMGSYNTAGVCVLEHPENGCNSVEITVETPLRIFELVDYFKPVIINDENNGNIYGKYSVVMGNTIYRNRNNLRPGVGMLVQCNFCYENDLTVSTGLTHCSDNTTLSLMTQKNGVIISHYGMISPFENKFGEKHGGYNVNVVDGRFTNYNVYKPFEQLTDEEQTNAYSIIEYGRETIRMLSKAIKERRSQDSVYSMTEY